MSELDEKQLMLYAQMANLVNLILQFPSIDLKEIAENFSKVQTYFLAGFSKVVTSIYLLGYNERASCVNLQTWNVV